MKTERSPYYELTLHPYENKEVILLRLHNNVDLINNSITAVDMANIGKCEELYSPDCILVQGAPGVGKSAFAWELSRKWAIGEALNNWSLVILVQLENKTVREAKSLQDFIYHPDSTVRKEICKYLKKKKGSGKTLFILDGYDRLSGKQQKNASWLQKLVLKELPKATLMILSRVALTGDMHHQFPFNLNIDQHIDITVFTDENIDKHIASAYSGDPGLATALKSYLSSHPFIHSLMYIPLQCAMVTDLYRIHWKCGDKEFAPRTMTELYTDLVRTLLLRYLSTHPEYSLSDDWVIDKFTDLQSLPGEVYERFEALAKLAALGIEKRVYVFDDSNLPEECQSLDLVENSLGLMYQVEEVYPGRGRSVSYRFLHLTLQEYLAAYHCSLDPTNRLEKVAGSLDRFLSNYHSTRAGICDHLAVWIFTAGLTKLSWIHQPLLLEIPQLLSSIAVTPMLHLLYEAQSPSLVLENLSFYTFSSDGSIEFKFFDMIEKSPLDWFVAGYCIPYSSRLWHLKTDSSCTDKHFDFLSKGLNVSSCQGCSGRIETLEVHASKIAMLHLLHPHTKALGELTIYAGYVDGTEKYAEQVVYNQFPSWYPLLKVLNIVNVSSLVLPLFEFLPKMCSGSLERLQLDFSPLLTRRQRPGNSSASKEDKDTIFKQLKECPVKQLKIKAQSRGHYPPLTISCKVESLQLTEITLTSALAECVGIEHNALHTLVLHSCKIPDDAGTALANSLQSPHCVLETIELDHKHDSSKIPDSVVEAIASCRTLKMCSMINCEDSILEHFVAGLKKNKSRVLEELTMCVNSFSSPGNVSELICVANEWSSITKMRLSSFLNNFVHQLDINFREDLVINYMLV